MKLKNIFLHLNKILLHKRWVMHFCFSCGLYWQGIIHDLSKFSPVEFLESVKYYNGTKSPIDVCKQKNGYSMAWFHHRGRNKHHYEYWTDNYDNGTIAIKMPYKYALEMVCDYLAAGVAYSGGINNFDMKQECNWWKEKRKIAKMHKDTIKLIDVLFTQFLNENPDKVLRDKKYMNEIKKEYEDGSL